ncbi:holin-like protein [Paenibacillus cellulosilyticus]|uniref:Holin-like protein n=1 Tax=Paenibacillus cellulosilyticus TaxID=375489 RepID=A0A2V2Z1I1_9BACL|nr:CidA/LrgA family protein [Paenibacillus cellulosilyticus]PWW06479.1 holin-like protein [Paenibacillus cellulosilyticus]QKS46179.1 CidA/LrgA family protein [Paenibacillus cellulosilyticus]
MLTLKNLSLTIVQIALLSALAIGSDRAAQWLHLPVPGSIIGAIILFALLKSGIVRLQWIERGANWLLAQMLLFFIPPCVGIIQYEDIVRTNGLTLLIAVVIGTVVVMAAIALPSGLIKASKARRLGRRNEVSHS